MAVRTNPLNEKQFERLQSSIEWSERQLEYPRKERIESIKQFVGFHHSSNGSLLTVPTPFLKMAVGIYIRLLAPRAPRALISTKQEDLKWVAANLELAVNQIPAEIELQKTLRRLVMEALFSLGVAKCGLHKVGEILGHSYGAPFVDVVTLDDLIIDMSAKHIEQIQYIGNSYWLNFEDVMESDWFPDKGKEGLKFDDYTIIGEAGEVRAEDIGMDESARLFKEKIWLRDIWLPAEGIMTTYAVKSKRMLKTFEWSGPKRGPYSILGFDDVPGNLLPLSPISIWRDLHELANVLFRKLADQADVQKTVLGFLGDDNEGVESFQNARDGEGITYHGTKPEKLTAGGIDSSTLLFFMQCKDLASYFASNLDSLGGLSPQAETLGQDRLLSAASGAQLRDMADRVIDFSRGIFGNLAYYEWNDLVGKRQLEKPIPGTDLNILVPWNRQSRRGKFDDFNLEIDIYSLQDDSPGLKLQKLAMIMQQYVIPLMPAIQAMGGSLDVQKLLEMVAKYSDFQEMGELVQFVQQTETPKPGGQGPGMAPNTTRTNVRVNRPGATEAGKSNLMQQVLAGGRPQGNEMAAMGRPTG